MFWKSKSFFLINLQILKLIIMKKIVFPIAVIIICIFSTNNTNAQVIQKKADKWQLINGVKLESETPKKNLIKLEATSVSPSVNSQNTDDIPKTRGVTMKKKNMQLNPENKYSKIKMKSTTFNATDSAKNLKSDLNPYDLDEFHGR